MNWFMNGIGEETKECRKERLSRELRRRRVSAAI